MDNYTGEPYKLQPWTNHLHTTARICGGEWRFASLSAADVEEAFAGRPPILKMLEFLLPINLGLASTVPVPGVVIDGGRQSMRLACWLNKLNQWRSITLLVPRRIGIRSGTCRPMDCCHV